MPWLTDRGRLFFDGMFNFVNNAQNKNTDWNKFFKLALEYNYFADHFNMKSNFPVFYYIVFDNISLETLNVLYILEQASYFLKLRKSETHVVNNDLESSFQLGNSLTKSNLNLSNLGLLINTNPRLEGYLLNLKLRLRSQRGDFKLLSIGSVMDLTFPTSFLGSSSKTIKLIGEGTHLSCREFQNSNFPTIILSTESSKRSDLKNLTKFFKYANIISNIWNGFNVLNHSIGSAGINYINKFLPFSTDDYSNFFGLHFVGTSLRTSQNMKKIVDIQILLNYHSDRFFYNNILVNQNNFFVSNDSSNIYDKLLNNSKVYKEYFNLPSKLFFEENETYLNTQGIFKRVTKCLNFSKVSKSNWQIIRKFFSTTRKTKSLSNVKTDSILVFDFSNAFNYKNYVNFHYYASSTLTFFSFYLTEKTQLLQSPVKENFRTNLTKLFETKLKNWLDDFFSGSSSDIYSQNSFAMTEFSKNIRKNSSNFF